MIEILCSRSNAQIKQIAATYKTSKLKAPGITYVSVHEIIRDYLTRPKYQPETPLSLLQAKPLRLIMVEG